MTVSKEIGLCLKPGAGKLIDQGLWICRIKGPQMQHLIIHLLSFRRKPHLDRSRRMAIREILHAAFSYFIFNDLNIPLRKEKICLTYFEIGQTYFKIQGTYFLEVQNLLA